MKKQRQHLFFNILLILCAFLILFLWITPSIYAQTARSIMEQSDAIEDGETSVTNMSMILINSDGKKRIRQTISLRKDYGEDSRSIIFFITPADVRNTSYLVYDWDDPEKDDDSWLYLPVVRKPKRIAASDRSGSFMGSDFTYTDINGIELEDWTYSFAKQKTQKLGEHECWVIIAKPNAKRKKEVVDETGYLQTQLWVRKDNYMVIKGKYWVKRGKKLKYFFVDKLEQIQGIWTALTMRMITTKSGKKEHSSILKINQIKYNTPLSDQEFTTTRIQEGLNNIQNTFQEMFENTQENPKKK